jgi:hypothetical protein
MNMNQFGLTIDQMTTGQIGVAGQNLVARHIVEHDRVAALTIHHRYEHVALGAFLERGDEFDQIVGGNQWLVGEHDDHRVEIAAECRKSHAHRALLALGMRGVVRKRHRKALHLFFDGIARITRHHHDLIDARTGERNQFPPDQRYALEPNQRLGYPAHAPARAGGQHHGADPQPGVQSTALFQ